jgi:hypothetical protein
MARSALSSRNVRRRRCAYPNVVNTVHAVITAIAAHAQPGRE